MNAGNKKDAQKQGQEVARLLGALVMKKEKPDFEIVADFAQVLAIDVFGYQGAELANSWSRGFIAEWMATRPSVQPVDLDGVDLTDLALRLLERKALAAPPIAEDQSE